MTSRETVVNVKVTYLRAHAAATTRYDNLREWMVDERNLYIGRQGVVFIEGTRFPPRASKWANPFKIGRDGDRETVLAKYRAHITAKIAEDPDKYNLEELRNRRLGCWCAPERCHGDVLLELLRGE